MSKFLGNDKMTVDEKGRIGIPARFMSALRAHHPDHCDKVGITISPDYSVKVMPLPDFERFMRSVQKLNDNDPQERLAKILYTSFADEVELDKQNRIKVSSLLMEECKIGRAVIVIGCQDHIQIFDEEVWREYRKLGMQNLGAATMRLTEIEKMQQAPVTAAAADGASAAGTPAH